MDPNTGSPYLIEFEDGEARKVEIGKINVPLEHRKFLALRGPHLHAYIQPFVEVCTVDVDIFLGQFPVWDTVQGYVQDNDDWDEAQHNEFKSALEWLSKSNCFLTRWSY